MMQGQGKPGQGEQEEEISSSLGGVEWTRGRHHRTRETQGLLLRKEGFW